MHAEEGSILHRTQLLFPPRTRTDFEVEFERIQNQMIQKPMLRAEVYAYAIHTSQNQKEEVCRKQGVH